MVNNTVNTVEIMMLIRQYRQLEYIKLLLPPSPISDFFLVGQTTTHPSLSTLLRPPPPTPAGWPRTCMQGADGTAAKPGLPVPPQPAAAAAAAPPDSKEESKPSFEAFKGKGYSLK